EKLVKGSYSYMSPEQLIGETNKQNDIWSFGVTLYKFLTGTHPYQSETIEELSEKMLLLEMDFPHHVNPQISAKLSYVIMRCLRKNKAEHYNDFEDVIEDLAGSPLRKAKFKKFKRNTFLWGIRLLIFLVIMIVLILVLTKISSLFDVVIIDNFDSVGIGPLLFGVVFYFFVVILLIRWRKKIGKKIILKNFIESGSVVKESKFIK
ncbi:MAG: serine/threonine protein kinase, partial [Paraglaciecola sp.]